jgi:hypothetical protein
MRLCFARHLAEQYTASVRIAVMSVPQFGQRQYLMERGMVTDNRAGYW